MPNFQLDSFGQEFDLRCAATINQLEQAHMLAGHSGCLDKSRRQVIEVQREQKKVCILWLCSNRSSKFLRHLPSSGAWAGCVAQSVVGLLTPLLLCTPGLSCRHHWASVSVTTTPHEGHLVPLAHHTPFCLGFLIPKKGLMMPLLKWAWACDLSRVKGLTRASCYLSMKSICPSVHLALATPPSLCECWSVILSEKQPGNATKSLENAHTLWPFH